MGWMAFLVYGSPAIAAAPGAGIQTDCHVGSYRNDDGEVLALTATPTQGWLRYVLVDGRTGILRPTGHGGQYVAGPGWEGTSPVVASAALRSCDARSIQFDLKAGPRGTWTRIPLALTDTRFTSHGVVLAGRLVEPPDGTARPAVVLVHGSTEAPYLDREPWQWLLPAAGVSVFVFDKRGTGASQGNYTQNFEVLAEDVSAAIAEARRVGDGRISRLGLAGFSQGGWVAPLAATKASVDFLEICYGVVGTPVEQDKWQVAYELAERGYGPEVLKKAAQVTDAAGRVAAADFSNGVPELRAVEARFQGQPWLGQIEGQYSGELLRGEIATAKSESPGVIWNYDSEAVLRKLSVPQLWMMAADDSLAPSAPTISRLRQLRSDGIPIEIAVFPATDHGIVNYSLRANGSHEKTRYALGYFRLAADWIKERLQPPYGEAHLEHAAVQQQGSPTRR
jgi:uncharacterized protein